MSINLPVGPLNWIAYYNDAFYTGTLEILAGPTVEFTCANSTTPVSATCTLDETSGALVVTTNFYFGSTPPSGISGTMWTGTLANSSAAASGVQLSNGLVMCAPGGIDPRPWIAYWTAGMSRNIFMSGSGVGATVNELVNPYPPAQGMEGWAVFNTPGQSLVSLAVTSNSDETVTINQPNSVQLNIAGQSYTSVEGSFDGQKWTGHFHPGSGSSSPKRGGGGDNWVTQSGDR